MKLPSFIPKELGNFSLDNMKFNVDIISRTILAYNQMNCINFMWLDTTGTDFSMSHSQINLDKQNTIVLSLQLVCVPKQRGTQHKLDKHYTLANNKGTHGNFCNNMVVHSQSDSEGSTINVNNTDYLTPCKMCIKES